MALKSIVDSLDGIHESLHDAYVEKDGKFHLAVDGMVPKARLDEFRDNNVSLKRQLDETTARFDGVDPDEFRKLSEQAQKIAEKKLIDAGKVEELFEARLTPMRAEHEKVVKALAAKEAIATKRLEGLLLDGGLRDAAVKAGVMPAAIPDVLARGRAVYRLHDGAAQAFDGDTPVYGKDGAALSMTEWATTLAESAPHLFTPSQGGGTPKGPTSGAAPGAKTMTRAQYDALPPMERAAAVKGVTLVD